MEKITRTKRKRKIERSEDKKGNKEGKIKNTSSLEKFNKNKKEK
jgi:hypothetical protein